MSSWAGRFNGLGAFDMVVTWTVKDTALAQVVNLVEDAQSSKASNPGLR